MIDFDGCTKGGRAYGQDIYVMGIEHGKVRVISAEKYPKELAGAGEK
ncbi:MAG: hypothetical protein JRH07_00120 [Deltaproteobacteria bacterium]|nr:hypothetical protein [Deltaproteobacteria bacterium]MBW2120239.1 hypothetical protein [Deltaproteobacteria bacterium]